MDGLKASIERKSQVLITSFILIMIYTNIDISIFKGVFPGNYMAPFCPNATGSAQYEQKRSTENPELPPRSNDGSSTSAWSKPIGQHMEALFGRKFELKLIY